MSYNRAVMTLSSDFTLSYNRGKSVNFAAGRVGTTPGTTVVTIIIKTGKHLSIHNVMDYGGDMDATAHNAFNSASPKARNRHNNALGDGLF